MERFGHNRYLFRLDRNRGSAAGGMSGFALPDYNQMESRGAEAFIYPEAITKILERGMKQPLPLAAFTRRSLSVLESSKGRKATTQSVTIREGQFVVEDDDKGQAADLGLSYPDLDEVATNLPMAVALLADFPDIHPGDADRLATEFAYGIDALFANTKARDEYRGELELAKKYLVARLHTFVRRRGLGVRLDVFDEVTWSSIRNQMASATQKENTSNIRTLTSQMSELKGRDGGRRDKDSKRRRSRSRDRRRRSHSQNSFRDGGHRRRSRSKGGRDAERCMYCNSSSHLSQRHPTDRPTKALTYKDGQWRDSEGRRFCYNFNRTKGYSRDKCDSSFRHACVRCGSSDHGAAACSSK